MRVDAHRGLSRRQATGFTLVELMVVMAIIAILIGMVLGAMSQAIGIAKLNKTKSVIARINQQLTARWESYRYRRVPIDLKQSAVSQGMITNVNQATPKVLAVARMNCIRELMRMELPDRFSDIIGNATPNPNLGVVRSSTSRAYQRKLTNTSGYSMGTNESAECLFLLMSQGLGVEGISAYDLVADSVGDTDGDGLREFLDGWGQPVRFMRWAPGFVSPLQPESVMSLAGASKNHDPFDPLGYDPEAYALYPLVYSVGPDTDGGLNTLPGNGTNANGYQSTSRVAGGFTLRPDPYVITLPANQRPGSVDPAYPGASLDNVHNHFIDLR